MLRNIKKEWTDDRKPQTGGPGQYKKPLIV